MAQQLSIAPTGKRITAAFIDIAIILVVYFVAVLTIGTHEHIHTATTTNVSFNLTGVPALVFCVLLLGYFVAMECNGLGSLGKLALGLRVVNVKNGERLSAQRSIIRNVLRFVDGFPYFIPYLLGAVVCATNERHQRIGDYLAKAVVIETSPRSRKPANNNWLT